MLALFSMNDQNGDVGIDLPPAKIEYDIVTRESQHVPEALMIHAL